MLTLLSCARPAAPPDADPPTPATGACEGALRRAAADALASASAAWGEIEVRELPSGRSRLSVQHGPVPPGPHPPASTIKPFLALAALEAGVVAPDEALPCGGSWTHGGQTAQCFAAHPPQTLESALATSCNAYFLEVASRLGPERLAHALEAAGFEAVAAATREAEGTAYLAVALGHGAAHVETSAHADAYARLLGSDSPHLRRVLTGMRRAFTDDEGSAREVAVAGLALAGKTGTAREDGEPHAHGWLAAHAPAEAPGVLVLAHLYGDGTGATLAGPVVKAVLEAWRDACPTRG